MIVALTGGIATGKSEACKFFKDLLPSVDIYDCDTAVSRFYGSLEVHKMIESRLDLQFRDSSGAFDKASLRDFVFENERARKQLESVFHPLVREELLAQLAEFATRGASALFVADVPLLFESNFDFGQNTNVVVATSRATQKYRLKERNHFEDELIENILYAQQPIERKIECADHVLWNEGPRENLHSQIEGLLAYFNIL